MAVHSKTLPQIRHSLARLVDDLILATLSDGTTTTAVLATTDPPQFRNKADDYFNDGEYEVYTYAGTNIGESAVASGWAITGHTLTVDRTLTKFDATSKLELHRVFTSGELLNAINLAIASCAGRFLVDIKDETTIVLVEGETNDGDTIYTYEYELPKSLLYIHRVTTEGDVSGKKLTGKVTAAFTLGETVAADVSKATGIISYEDSSGDYILVREVDGTFAVGDTVTGASGSCGALTEVDDETVGDGKFEMEDVVDPRDYTIIKSYPPKIKFNEDHYTVVGDLRVRLEGQGSQDTVSADIDNIFIPDDWLVMKAMTFLPYSKIESANLLNTFKSAEARSARPLSTAIHGNSKAVIE